MVPCFQDVRMKVGAACEQPLLRLETGISGEQHAEPAVRQHRHDRVLVHVVLAIRQERSARREDVQADAVAARPAAAALRYAHGRMPQRRFPHAVIERNTAVSLSAVEDLADPQRSEDRSKQPPT